MSVSSFPLKQWHHIAVILQDGDNTKIYKDGELVGAGTITFNTSFTAAPMIIGGQGWNAGPPRALWNGAIDDLRIYDRALSTSDVQELYAYGRGPILALLKAVRPVFTNLSVGTNYQLQVSGDMSTWTNHDSPFTATSPALTYPECWDVDNWNSLFFRLKAAP